MQQYQASRHNLEWEANEFAGRLLVSVERLKADFDAFVGQIKTQFPTWWANNHLREALADLLAEVYGVHKDVIACRLDREEFLPTKFTILLVNTACPIFGRTLTSSL
jgi:Zn-dependent peptidase ImmA (M78 family)